MAEIKRIQLRGISRTPSDRMTDDGGCAESLNVHLDNTEVAPMLMPEDKTSLLFLKDGAKKIFIHKLVDRENYIVVLNDRVNAQIPGRIQTLVSGLEMGEKVPVITSLGNTLIIYAGGESRYFLFQNDSYRALGQDIPFPTIEFFDVRTPLEERISSKHIFGEQWAGTDISYINTLPLTSVTKDAARGVSSLSYYGSNYEGDSRDIALINLLIELYEGAWNELNDSAPLYGEATKEAKEEIRKTIEAEISSMVNHNAERGIFSYPMWALYAVKLYDGSRIISCPQLISPGCDTPFDINITSLIRPQDSERLDASNIDIYANNLYKLGVRMYEKTIFDNWEDIVESIEIYISDDINTQSFDKLALSGYKEINFSSVDIKQVKVARLKGEVNKTFREEAMLHSVFVKVEEFKVNRDATRNISLIESDFILDAKQYIKGQDRFAGRTLLSDTDYRFRDYAIVPHQSLVFNNSILYSQVEKKYSPGPQWLLCQRYNTKLPWVLNKELIDGGISTSLFPNYYFLDRDLRPLKSGYSFKFSYSFNDEGVTHGSSYGENYYKPIDRYDDLTPVVYDLVMFPSLDCRETQWQIIKGGEKKYGFAKMTAHPTFPNLVYSFRGEELASRGGSNGNLPEPRLGKSTNVLYKTFVNNPFIIDSKYIFDSGIISVAVSTTALSQGQFGQFPLYVFTEDGIWAMETATDGSFLTSKPLSRDVCVNPDSITSIDNAVVFVSAKGVMLLHGSQVTNISPFMNGRHYTIESGAKKIIENQDFFCDLLPALSDQTHFFAFVKEATVAYDYSGQRFIFIKKDEKYQYVYKLDTQTWHKVAYGVNLIAPLNSYPECLIQGEEDGKTRIYDLSTILDAAESQTPMRGVIATRPFDLGEPDVFKTITDVRIRGQFPRGAAKFILLGSNDGVNFTTISTLRGRSWKLFRMIILADLAPTERISWVDIMYETKFTNKLR